MTIKASAVSSPLGAGSDMRSGSAAIFTSSSFRRSYWERAEEKPFHAPIIRSIGARARPSRMEPAIIRPGLISCSSAR
ncbi:hypothetical protein D3C81_1961800 [compost metagenome]